MIGRPPISQIRECRESEPHGTQIQHILELLVVQESAMENKTVVQLIIWLIDNNVELVPFGRPSMFFVLVAYIL